MSHSFHHTLLYTSVPACSGTLYLQVMGRLVKNLIGIMSGKKSMHIRVLLKLHWNMRNNEEYCKDGASEQYSFFFRFEK